MRSAAFSYDHTSKFLQGHAALGIHLTHVLMRRKKQLGKAFGLIEDGKLIDYPRKISNVKISRMVNFTGCSYCFPHGLETYNSTIANRQRNWKRFRKWQWKNWD
jgi:hypothetical protein